MKAEIRKIGNSRGIILPKSILDQCHFENDVDMEITNNALIIRPIFSRRAGWKESFEQIHRSDEDKTLLKWQNVVNVSDTEDFEW